MRNRYAWSLVSLLSLACGDGGGAEGKTLGELSTAEAQALCEELRPYTLRTWSVACTQEALHTDPSGGVSCKSEREACISESVSDCSQSHANEGGCKAARVSDVRDCFKAGAKSSEQAYGSKDVDCSTGVHPTGTVTEGVPDSCQRIEDSCSDMW